MRMLKGFGGRLGAGLSRIRRIFIARKQSAQQEPRRDKPQPAGQRCCMSPLEDRQMMSVSPVLPSYGLINFSINNAAVLEGNGGNNIQNQALFTVSLPGISINPVSVHYSTADWTAKAGVDYEAVEGTLIFPRGVATQTFTVPIIGNTIQQGNRKFYVNLSQAVGAPINPSYGTGVGTIVDDDLPVVTVRAVDASASEARSDPGVFRFSRTGSTRRALKAAFSIKGTATNGVDYTRISGWVTIPAGKSSADVVITPLKDALKEPDETSIATVLQKPAYFIGTAKSATITLSEGDPIPPSARIVSAPAVTMAGAAAYQFTVRYVDDTLLNAASIGDGNLRVSGPSGYLQSAQLVSSRVARNGKSATAVYSIPAPGGSWDATDNGSYTITVVAGKIRDKAGNAVTAGGLGAFTVSI